MSATRGVVARGAENGRHHASSSSTWSPDDEPSSPPVSLLPHPSVSPGLPQRRPHPVRPTPSGSGGDDYLPLLSGVEEDAEAGRRGVSPRERHHSLELSGFEYDKEKSRGKDRLKGKGKDDSDSDTDKEMGKVTRDREHIGHGGTSGAKLSNQAFVAGVAYCLSSCSMILLNKVVLSTFQWKAQITLMFYQNLVSVCVVATLSRTGLIATEHLTWRLARIWAPVNVLFVGMLVTSFFSLQYMQVAMVMILKNVTNLVTAVGEMYLFKKRHSPRVWGSLFLMILSAVSGGITDLSFHPVGYSWQLLNCFFTAAYSLTLRRVMDKAKAATISGQLSEFSMVLLNNSLSLPLAIILLPFFGEIQYLRTTPLLHMPSFWTAATISGLLGLAISFTSMWFLHETSPTTYSLVGSLNKIPLSIAGIVLFRAPTNLANLGSIFFGCFAGVVFARAKLVS